MAHNIDHSPQGEDAAHPGTDDRRSTITEQLGELEEGVRASAADATAAAAEMVENVHDLVGTTVDSVRQSLAGASAAADEIAETVGEAVGDAIASVQRAVDLRSQVARHPWLLMGGAVLVGYWLGSPRYRKEGDSRRRVRGRDAARGASGGARRDPDD
jgi:hypothetical protein